MMLLTCVRGTARGGGDENGLFNAGVERSSLAGVPAADLAG